MNTTPMRSPSDLILVSNDDGFEAAELWVLARAAGMHGPVAIVAPHREQSGAGRSYRSDHPHEDTLEIHAREPLETIPNLIGAWSVTATPARAVLAALHALDLDPTFMVSGLNTDLNAGLLITASGTLGAAWEAASAGIPAAAFSKHSTLDAVTNPHVTTHLHRLIGDLLTENPAPAQHSITNINLPAAVHPDTEHRTTHVSRHSPFRQFLAPAGPGQWKHVSDIPDITPEPGSDLEALHQGHISITRLP